MTESPAAPSGEPNDPDTLALLHIEQILTAHYGSVQREISYAVLRAAGAASVRCWHCWRTIEPGHFCTQSIDDPKPLDHLVSGGAPTEES